MADYLHIDEPLNSGSSLSSIVKVSLEIAKLTCFSLLCNGVIFSSAMFSWLVYYIFCNYVLLAYGISKNMYILRLLLFLIYLKNMLYQRPNNKSPTQFQKRVNNNLNLLKKAIILLFLFSSLKILYEKVFSYSYK